MTRNKKRTPRYSNAEKQAYWVGVGISAERHNEAEMLLNSKNPKIKKSLINGYNADNYRNVSKKLK